MIYSGIKGSVPLLKAAPWHCQPSLHTIKGVSCPGPPPFQGNEIKQSQTLGKPRSGPSSLWLGPLQKDPQTRHRSGLGSCSSCVLCQGPVCDGELQALGLCPHSRRGMLRVGVSAQLMVAPCKGYSCSWGLVRCSWSPGLGKFIPPPVYGSRARPRPCRNIQPPPPAQHLQAPSKEGAGWV